MYKMHSNEDYFCSDCNISFLSASDLLKHFATHAIQTDKNNINKDKCIPDLYPITTIKEQMKQIITKDFEEIDENLIPLKVCLVTMDDNNDVKEENSLKLETKNKNFLCSFCRKSFGWLTDLKRHTLTHTGEKPFKCDSCNAKFTRKFILQKHKIKNHFGCCKNKVKIPQLKRLISKKPNIKVLKT